MKKIKMKRQSTERIKLNNPLLVEQDMLNLNKWEEGDLVELVDNDHNFLAKAILAKQNKGIGWVFTRQIEQAFDETLFKKLFTQAIVKREAMPLENTTAYRLFNAESDGLGGVTIDIYNQVAVFSWYSLGIYRYAKQIIDSFLAVAPWCQAVYEKCRFEPREVQSRFVTGKEVAQSLIITENTVKYATYMNDGLMTGIFLDQRDVRNYVMQTSKNQSVLNLFSYTGAFSVAAAVGGASQTVSVDVANRSIERTKEQFALNGYEIADMHKLYIMDSFDYLKYALRKNLNFDCIILDPPSFARTKKSTFSVMKDYKNLLKQAIAVTAPKGRLIISTNAAQYSLKAFKEMIEQAFSEVHTSYSINELFKLPADFTTLEQLPLTDYLKVFVVTVN